MILIECTACKDELDYPGGLVFSIPDNYNQVEKYHLCGECTNWILGIIQAGRVKEDYYHE